MRAAAIALLFVACSSGAGPRVVAVNLAGAEGVARNAAVLVRFDRAVDAASVTAGTVRVESGGVPAAGEVIVDGAVVTFLPRLPRLADKSDAGLAAGRVHDVIVDGVTAHGVPVPRFAASFATGAGFLDEGLSFGGGPCAVDAPGALVVVRSDPAPGESGVGRLEAVDGCRALVGLGVTVEFSEPVDPATIAPVVRHAFRPERVIDAETVVEQDRTRATVRLALRDREFAEPVILEGRYEIEFDGVTDLAGNLLADPPRCVADGRFVLGFSTVAVVGLPTEQVISFEKVGGLPGPVRDPDAPPPHEAPFVGGLATDQPGVVPASPSAVTSSADLGRTAYWTGAEIRYDAGAVEDALRLRGAARGAATAVLAPVAGRGTGPSHPQGTATGSVVDAAAGKTDFLLEGPATAALFTGDAATGQIVYHYRSFAMRLGPDGARPSLSTAPGSAFPLVILVEEDAAVAGDVTGAVPLAFGAGGDIALSGNIAVHEGSLTVTCAGDLSLEGAVLSAADTVRLADGDGVDGAAAAVPPPATLVTEVYGDDAREPGFARSRIVTEWLDVVCERSNMDRIVVLSNAPRFPAGTIRVFLDATDAADGAPDLSGEAADGSFGAFTREIPLDRTADGSPAGALQFESRFLVDFDDVLQERRYYRIRIEFDLARIGPPADLLRSFGGGDPVPIAPGNTFGNADAAPPGVPAVAEVRVLLFPN